MDRYDQVSLSLSKGTIIRVRMFYNQPSSTKRVLELFFRVEQSFMKTSLGSLSQILQEEVIKKLTRLLSKDTYWTQLAIYIPSNELKVTINIPTVYGRRLGNAQLKPFAFEVIPESSNSYRRQVLVYGASSEFSQPNMQQISEKKQNKDAINYREILDNLEYMFLFPIPKESKGFTLQLVVPIREGESKSKAEAKSKGDKTFPRRIKDKEELVSYVNLMACNARGFVK